MFLVLNILYGSSNARHPHPSFISFSLKVLSPHVYGNIVKVFPRWVHPNILTGLGFLSAFTAAALAMYHSPKLVTRFCFVLFFQDCTAPHRTSKLYRAAVHPKYLMLCCDNPRLSSFYVLTVLNSGGNDVATSRTPQLQQTSTAG